MAEPEATLRESPVDFDSAVAYALHPEMRRLLILYIVGTILTTIGIRAFYGTEYFGGIPSVVGNLLGLLIALIGAVFLFGGLIGAAFKVIADANILAMSHE